MSHRYGSPQHRWPIIRSAHVTFWLCYSLWPAGILVAQPPTVGQASWRNDHIRRLSPLEPDLPATPLRSEGSPSAARGAHRDSRFQQVATPFDSCPELRIGTAKQAVYLHSAESTQNNIRRVAGEEVDVGEPIPEIKPIDQIDLRIDRGDPMAPPDYARPWLRQQGAIHHVTGTSRSWPVLDYRWAASAIAYHPLYFEDVNLERYGYSCGCLQPAVSYAHFFGNVVLLPYHMAETPPCECMYSLGHYRPGSCAPYYRKRWFPLDAHAGATEAATIAGLILLIP